MHWSVPLAKTHLVVAEQMQYTSCMHEEYEMAVGRGILFKLNKIGFDDYGRAVVSDRRAASTLYGLLEIADAIACQSGCGAPLSCDTALIARDELLQIGPDLLINNADFASIIRKRKAASADETVLVFTEYKKLTQAEQV
jgi:hypothetical protein